MKIVLGLADVNIAIFRGTPKYQWILLPIDLSVCTFFTSLVPRPHLLWE